MMLAICSFLAVGCGDDASSLPIDAKVVTGPSTDPSTPTAIAIETPMEGVYDGMDHFFVFTAPTAGVYSMGFTAPATGQINHCATTGGCLCSLGAGGNCCLVDEGQTRCGYLIEAPSGAPLAAGERIYPVVHMPTGVTGPYDVFISGPL